jgi:hypothetical protein
MVPAAPIIIIIIINLITLLSMSAGKCSPIADCRWVRLRGKKFTLSPKVKSLVLRNCLLYDMFVVVLLVAPLLRWFWLDLYSLNILGCFW